MSVILVAGLMLPVSPGIAQYNFSSQLSEEQKSDIKGHWVGSGRSNPVSSRNRCGDGPIIELTVQTGVVKATLKLMVRKMQEIDILVIPVRGTIDDHGNMKLAGYESKVVGMLSASTGTGEGTWETVTYGCGGPFQLRYKSSVFAWPTASGVE